MSKSNIESEVIRLFEDELMLKDEEMGEVIARGFI